MKIDTTKLRTIISHEISRIDVLDEIDSTNTYLKQEGKKGAPHGTLVIAKKQTAGRGRMNRLFVSDEGGLYMSLLLRPQMFCGEPGLYTMAAATSVVTAIEKMTKLPTEIKWVNDVLLNNKKVCGILTEGVFPENSTTPDFIVVGIGINVNTTEFPEDLRDIVTSMRLEDMDDRTFNLNIVAIRVINAFMEYTKYIEERSFLPLYREKLNCIGKDIYPIDTPEKVYHVNDINENGNLITVSADGTERIFSTGEVSIKIQ